MNYPLSKSLCEADLETYQLAGIDWLLGHSDVGLFLYPGMGKTAITLTALARKGHKALVVAPWRVASLTWPAEIQKWEHLRHLRYSVLHGARKEQALQEDADIYLINPEGLPWLSRKQLPPGVDVLVVDELTKFKSVSTASFKLICKLRKLMEFHWGLTGTAAASGYLNLYGQVYVIDGGNAFGQYYTRFRAKYFRHTATIPVGNRVVPIGWTPLPGSVDEINALMRPFCLTMRDIDHIEVPALIENVVEVDMGGEAMQVYNTLKKRLAVEFREEVVKPVNAAVRFGCLRQIASGFLYLRDSGGKATEIHTAKLDALHALIEELQGQPLFIGYNFTYEAEAIANELNAPNITDVSEREAETLIARWREGAMPVMLAHTSSAAHGLNLQGACGDVCFYSLPLSYEVYDQLIRRVMRRGTEHKTVRVHILSSKGTVDSYIASILRAKKNSHDAMFNSLCAHLED